MSSNYTQYFIRSTHVTGTCTDIGLIAGRRLQSVWYFYRRRRNNADDSDEDARNIIAGEVWKEKYLITLLVGFYFGVLIGAYLWVLIGPQSIFIPVSLMGLMLLTQFIIAFLSPGNVMNNANDVKSINDDDDAALVVSISGEINAAATDKVLLSRDSSVAEFPLNE
jgi:hypothetical protein